MTTTEKNKKINKDGEIIQANPNGSNQFEPDPRQIKCWADYINPKSKTFGNAYQSAINAGYSNNTANQITTIGWFKSKKRRLGLLDKAEKVLEETLDLEAMTTQETQDGELYEKVDVGILRVKNDAAKFVAGTQGKNEGYTTRVETELSGDVNVQSVQYTNSTKKCEGCFQPTLNEDGVCSKCKSLETNN
jgi:hypothetical protein